jgi:hypothetical protein
MHMQCDAAKRSDTLTRNRPISQTIHKCKHNLQTNQCVCHCYACDPANAHPFGGQCPN